MVKLVAILGGLLILSATFVQCGGTPLHPPTPDGSSGMAGGSAGGTGGSSGGGGVGGTAGHVSPCPAEPPQEGADCTQEGLMCGWGDDVRGDFCRTLGACSAGRWKVTLPSTTSCTPLQPIGACPTDLTGACTMDATCVKSDASSCRCTNCRPTSPLCAVASSSSWYCPQSPTTTGCPPTPPNFGETCSVEGVDCGYFSFECGVPDRVCTHGIWTPGQTLGCPQSSRRFKKDIHYLSDENIDALAAQTLRLRLATYEYKSAPYAGRRHLGFIIEDSPKVPAVDRDGDMVDLYGYTSMLLATTQAQQKQIESLQKKVEDQSQTVERLSRQRPHPP